MAKSTAAITTPAAIAIARSVFISAPPLPGRPKPLAGYTTIRKFFSRRVLSIKGYRTVFPTTRFIRVLPTDRECRRRASGSQGVVQFPYETLRPRHRVGRIVPALSLLLVKVIGNVQCREDSNFCRVHGCRPLGDFFHPGIHKTGEVVHVGTVSFGADIVCLPEDLDLSHVAPLVRGQLSGSFRSGSLVPVLSRSQRFRGQRTLAHCRRESRRPECRWSRRLALPASLQSNWFNGMGRPARPRPRWRPRRRNAGCLPASLSAAPSSRRGGSGETSFRRRRPDPRHRRR